MKKLIIILGFLLAFTAVAEAQIATLYMRKGQTYTQYTTDVTLTNAVAQYFVLDAKQDWPCAQIITMQLDSATGDHTSVTVDVSGRASKQTDTWTAIGSQIEWLGGLAGDTTIIFTNATENRYIQYKVLFTGTGTGTTTIDNFECKLFYPD